MGRGRNTSSATGGFVRRAQAQLRNPAAVVIRAATAADIPALAQLKTMVARRTYEGAHGGAALESWLEAAGENHYRYRVGRAGYLVLLAEDARGEIVGVATMRIRGQRADMSGLYVATPGCGVGRALVAARAQAARQRGCTHVRASVWRSNEGGKRFVAAQGLVRRGGYRERTVGVMVDHYEGVLSKA